VKGVKQAIFGLVMQKSVHELWGGKITIFELPPDLAARDENFRDRGRAEAVFGGQIPGKRRGGLSYGPFRPEGEF
jgi:hypothetical protein